MSKFKVGDKVIMRNDLKTNKKYGNVTFLDRMNEVKGKPTTVVIVDNDGTIRVRDGLGFWYDESMFEFAKEQKIVITTDGKTTTAVLYNGKQRIKEAKSVCAPEDEFDFNYGASLALDRLTGFVRGSVDNTLEVKPKYFTGKVRCVKVVPGQKSWLTEGKVYKFINGYSIDDVGDRLPACTQIHSVKELNSVIYSDFEEVNAPRSQIEKFLAGDIIIEVSDGKATAFLTALEQIDPSLRWRSGDKPTKWGASNRYFSIKNGRLGYHGNPKVYSPDMPIEKWNGDDLAVCKELKAISSFIKLMKEICDD